MERRFVIALMPNDEEGFIESITESELKRRLSVIMCYGPDDRVDWDTCINRLLHGMEKKEAQMPPLRGMTIEEIKRNYPREYADAISKAEQFTDQPDPWEEWIEKMPYEHQQIGGYGIWYQEMKSWFRKMPRR